MTWLNDAFLVVKAMAYGFYVATPYWVLHAMVALTIALVLWPVFGLNAGLTAGAAFYCGREYTQWESNLPFDWNGLAAPLATCLLLLVFSTWWHK